MGATGYEGGTTFRVWAMFCDSVAVAGDFNGWSTTANPLAQESGTNLWSADVEGAAVGQAYKYYVPYAADPNRQPWRVDPYANSVREVKGDFKAVITTTAVHYHESGFKTPAWNKAVIYELHIPTFSTQQDGSAGTFKTAIEKLPGLAEIGINAIELMPLGQFQSISFSGYNPGYIFAVEDQYGGPDGFREFVNEAHNQGIAVLVDVVYNHAGNTDLWQFDGWSENNLCPYYWAEGRAPGEGWPTNGGIYFFQDARAHTDFSHAKFDFGRPEVCSYLLDNATRWLQERFADGLRFDSVVNMRAIEAGGQFEGDIPEGKALLTQINQTIHTAQEWKITIAEDLQNDGSITDPVDGGGFGFNAQWNDAFCYALRNAASAPTDSARNISGLASTLFFLSRGGYLTSVVYSENHDKDDPNENGGRLPSIIGGAQSDSWNAKKQSTLAAAVVLTVPGIPMLFEGQEFLEYRPFFNSGATAPQPIDWTRATQFAGIRSLYHDLIQLRRNLSGNTAGLQGPNISVLPVFADNVLAYHRWNNGGEGDDVVVVCNFSYTSYPSYAVGLPRDGMWRVRFNSDSKAYDPGFGGGESLDTDANGPPLNGMPFSGNVGLPAYTCIILSQ